MVRRPARPDHLKSARHRLLGADLPAPDPRQSHPLSEACPRLQQVGQLPHPPLLHHQPDPTGRQLGCRPAAESADHSAHRPGRPAEVLRLLFKGKPAAPDVSDPAASGPVGQGRLRLKDSPGINLAPGLLYRTTPKHSVRFRMFGGYFVYLVSCNNKVSPASS